MSERYLLIKHSEGWNVDRCCAWMDKNSKAYDWFYPIHGEPFPDPRNYYGVIVFGGAPSANDDTEHPWVISELTFIQQCLECRVGFFGICLGAQMLARALGATISTHPDGATEIGQCRIEPTEEGASFLTEPMTVMQWHREGFELPEGCVNLARSDLFEYQAFRVNELVYGVQFHPEVNPASLAVWQERNRQKSPDQFTDAERAATMAETTANDATVTAWLDRFLSQWTSTIQILRNESAAASRG